MHEFQKANSLYKTAKETLSVAEHSLNRGEIPDAWQEHLSSTITKINLSKKEADKAEEFHRKKANEYSTAEQRLNYLKKEFRRSISKAQPYYEEKMRWTQQMERQRNRVNDLEHAIVECKSIYKDAMKNLSKINEEIHTRRKMRKEQEEKQKQLNGGANNQEFTATMTTLDNDSIVETKSSKSLRLEEFSPIAATTQKELETSLANIALRNNRLAAASTHNTPKSSSMSGAHNVVDMSFDKELEELESKENNESMMNGGGDGALDSQFSSSDGGSNATNKLSRSSSMSSSTSSASSTSLAAASKGHHKNVSMDNINRHLVATNSNNSNTEQSTGENDEISQTIADNGVSATAAPPPPPIFYHSSSSFSGSMSPQSLSLKSMTNLGTVVEDKSPIKSPTSGLEKQEYVKSSVGGSSTKIQSYFSVNDQHLTSSSNKNNNSSSNLTPPETPPQRSLSNQHQYQSTPTTTSVNLITNTNQHQLMKSRQTPPSTSKSSSSLSSSANSLSSSSSKSVNKKLETPLLANLLHLQNSAATSFGLATQQQQRSTTTPNSKF